MIVRVSVSVRPRVNVRSVSVRSECEECEEC